VFDAEAKQADFLVLPGGGMYLQTENIPKVEVQPDATITTQSVYCDQPSLQGIGRT